MGAKDVRAGGAYVELGVRARLDKGLQAAARKLRSFGTSVVTVGTGLVAGAAGAAAPLISAASDAQEVGSKFDTVFGANADSVRQWGNIFADQVGRSRMQIEQFLSGTQDLFVPLGFDADAAEDMSKTVSALAIDLASFNNMQDADTMRDLQAALTGSGETMKKYGVLVDAAAVKQELLNKGIDPAAASNQEKVMARLAIILRGTTAAQGDAVRTSGSFANQTKRLWGNLHNVAVTLGRQLLPMATKAVELFNRVAMAVMNYAEQNEGLVQKIAYVIAGVGAVGGLLVSFGTVALALGTALPMVATAAGAVASVFGLLISPVGLGAGAIAGLTVAAYRNREAIVAWIGSVVEWFASLGQGGGLFQRIHKTFRTVAGYIRESLASIWENVTSTFGGVRDAIAAQDYQLAAKILWAGVKVAFVSGMGQLEILWINFTTGLKEVWSMMGHSITSAFRTVVRVIAAMIRNAMDLNARIFGTLAEYDPTAITGKIASGYEKVGEFVGIMDEELAARQESADEARRRQQLARGRANLAAIEDVNRRVDEARAARQGLVDRARVQRKLVEFNAASEAADEAAAGDGSEGLGATIGGALSSRGLVGLIQAAQDAGARFVESDAFKKAYAAQKEATSKGQEAKTTLSTAGTFSAAGAQLLGLGGANRPQEETARNTARMATTLEQIAKRRTQATQQPVFE